MKKDLKINVSFFIYFGTHQTPQSVTFVLTIPGLLPEKTHQRNTLTKLIKPCAYPLK